MSLTVKFVLENSSEVFQTEASSGELLTQVASRAGVTIQQTCGGSPSCTDCKIKVLSNFDQAFEDMAKDEERLLGNVYHITRERLSCQAVLTGDVEVLVPDAKEINRKVNERLQSREKSRKDRNHS